MVSGEANSLLEINVVSERATIPAYRASQKITVDLTGGGADMILSASPPTIPADGKSNSTITALVIQKPGTGIPVTDGTLISFEADYGLITPKALTSGGKATAILTAPSQLFTNPYCLNDQGEPVPAVRVSVTSKSTKYICVMLEKGEVWSIELTSHNVLTDAPLNSIPADGSSTIKIKAAVKSEIGEPVEDGTKVDFTTTLGSITPSSLTQDGTAIAILKAGTNAGIATINAKVKNVSKELSVTFETSGIVTIDITSEPSSILADGKSKSIIKAFVKDPNGNPVKDGTSVDFLIATGLGSVTSPHTTKNGIATAELTAPLNSGSAKVKATSEGYTTPEGTEVTFYSPAITLSPANASLTANGKSTITITARVTDPNGNAVPDKTLVTFTNTGGGMITQSALTTNGEATAILTSPTSYVYPAKIKAYSCGGVSNEITISFLPGPAKYISLSANPTNIRGWDTVNQSVQITGFISDEFMNPLPAGNIVSFTTTGGMILSPVTTTANGQFTTTLYTGYPQPTGGVATIIATSGSATGTVSVTFSGQVANLKFSTSTVSIAYGTYKDITVTVEDINGQPVVAGGQVVFTLTPTIGSKLPTMVGMTPTVIGTTPQTTDRKTKDYIIRLFNDVNEDEQKIILYVSYSGTNGIAKGNVEITLY